MNPETDGIEKQLQELRAEVAALRRALIRGFIAVGCVFAVFLSAPGLGVLAVLAVLILFVAANLGAFLGIWSGKLVRKVKGA